MLNILKAEDSWESERIYLCLMLHIQYKEFLLIIYQLIYNEKKKDTNIKL